MRSILKMIFVTALLAAPGAALAQEQEQEAPAETPEELNLGEPVGPQVGEPYVREEFDDWALRCRRAAEGPDPCNLYQLLVNEADVPVAEFNIVPLPPGRAAVAGATVVVPLETLLTEQLTIAIDGGEARRYPFSFCNRAGCVARFGFTQDQIDLFKRGNAATVRIVPAGAPSEEFVLNLSLSGFTAGFDSTTAE